LSLTTIALIVLQAFAVLMPSYFHATVSGQPTEILAFKWRRNLSGSSGHACGGVVTADINRDGIDEVFYAGNGRAYCLNGTDGSTIWETAVSGGTDQPQMADLNGDGILDLMVVVSSSGLEVLFGQNGSRYWRRTGLGGSCANSPIACDINFDGLPEVFFCTEDITHGENGTGRVTSLTHNGQIISQLFAWRPCAGGLSVGDTDLDGNFELYMGDRHMYYGDGNFGRGVRSFNILPNGTLTTRWDAPDILCSSHIPMLADVNKDGIQDVIACHQLGGLAVLRSSDGSAIKKQLYLPTNDSKPFPGHYQMSICDIDYDGNLEILAADGDHPERSTPDVVIWDLVTWKEDGRMPHVCKMGPKVGDVTGDGQLDVIVASYTGLYIYTWNATINNFSFVTSKTGLSGTLGNAVLADVDGDQLIELLISSSSGAVYAYDTPASTPRPRPRSEVQFYSESRLGVAEYVHPPGPQPRVYNEIPYGASKEVSISLSQLSFDLSDPNGNLMNYTVTTSPNIGASTGTNVGNGKRTVSIAGLDYETTYTWQVSATDGTYWTNRTYRFTTSSPSKPVVSGETPSDGASEVSVLLPKLSFNLFEPDGDPMNYTVTTSPDIGSESGSNVPDGCYNVTISGLEYNTTYSWQVNVTDGTYWNNESFSFTTEPSTPPWWNNGWQYRKKIVIDHTKVNESFSGFPVLISMTDGDLASKAQSDGDDILFIDENGAKLNHEIESYNNSDGNLVAWVDLLNLSSTEDTILYMYYGNADAPSQENATGTWDSNFMMVQHLSETSGTLFDSTSNANDGLPSGGLNQSVVGKIDGADDFDGVDDYVNVPHDSTLTGYTEAFTASFWIKMDEISRRQAVLSKYDTAGNQRGWLVDYRGDSTLGLLVSPDGINYDWWYAAFSPNAGNWYYVAVVWESNQLPRFYINGAPITTSNTNTTSSVYENSGTPLRIGMCTYTPGREFNGILDEVRISNISRSAGWIKTCYNNQQNPLSFFSLGIEETQGLVATLQISPETTYANLGDSFTVYVEALQVVDLYGWEFQLNYDPVTLDLTSTSIVAGGLKEPIQTYYNLVDETNGHLWWAVSTTHPTTTGITYASHYVFEMQFQAIAPGVSYLDLYGTILSDSSANPIPHVIINGSAIVSEPANIDLVVTSVAILNLGCTMYANDTYVGGSTYYYPVEVTIDNVGTATATSFYLKLEVYWINGSLSEASTEVFIETLAPESGGLVVNFTGAFHPTNTGFYSLTATVDSRDDIAESNESNNTQILGNVPVAVMGDVNGDRVVNILDGIVVSLAWSATPLDAQWNIKADLNHDGVINVLDGVRVGVHWTETW
jgi:hypothetical protein